MNRWLSSKEIHMAAIDRWHREIVEIICKLEKEFPPSFMDIEVHLLIHLVDDIDMAGVMSARNMFFIERFLKVLKGFVRQHSQLEGSMDEGYIV